MWILSIHGIVQRMPQNFATPFDQDARNPPRFPKICQYPRQGFVPVNHRSIVLTDPSTIWLARGSLAAPGQKLLATVCFAPRTPRHRQSRIYRGRTVFRAHQDRVPLGPAKEWGMACARRATRLATADSFGGRVSRPSRLIPHFAITNGRTAKQSTLFKMLVSDFRIRPPARWSGTLIPAFSSSLIPRPLMPGI